MKAKGPSYDTRADAEAFLELVALAGWPAALDYVNQEPVVDTQLPTKTWINKPEEENGTNT